MQGELLALQGFAKVRFEREMFGRPRTDGFLEKLNPALTDLFCVVHGGVGILDERLRAAGVSREHADADARRQRYFLLRERKSATGPQFPSKAHLRPLGLECH